ncbi:unnamed protein product, partial [Rotaria sp. Silwood2]
MDYGSDQSGYRYYQEQFNADHVDNIVTDYLSATDSK